MNCFPMKLIIAGGRDYQFTEADYDRLDALHERTPVSEVVSGKAPGADTCGEEWARRHGLPVAEFPADWEAHGRAAGPMRNHQMAVYADAVALFPGGRGTRSMHRLATKEGILIFDFREAGV